MKKLYAITEHQKQLIEMLLKEAGASYTKENNLDVVVFNVKVEAGK